MTEPSRRHPARHARRCAPASATENLDWAAIGKIRDEGFRRSQVMETAAQLTDVHGPRLSGSPQYKEAAEWARKQLESWGLANAHLESFEFGRGWSFERSSAHVVAPVTFPLVAIPKAWTAGTGGTVRGKVVRVKVDSEADVEKFKGKLAGLVVWAGEPRELALARGARPVPALQREGARRARAVPGPGRARRARARRRAAVRPRGVPAAAPAAARRSTSSTRPRSRSRSSSPRRATRTCCCSAAAARARRATRRRSPSSWPRPCSGRASRACSSASSTSRSSSTSRHLLRGRHERLQRRGRAARRRQEGRAGDGRRPLRLLAPRHRRDRQRRGLGRDDGGDADPEGDRREAAADDPHRPLGRRGAGAARLARVRLGALRLAARRARSPGPTSCRASCATTRRRR